MASTLNLSFSRIIPVLPARTRFPVRPAHCIPLQVSEEIDAGILCELCNGKGWLICDFCKGQKTNIKAENKRIYRRCPSCRAIGYVLCPSYGDGLKCLRQMNKEGGRKGDEQEMMVAGVERWL